jgi:hypothetical protein
VSASDEPLEALSRKVLIARTLEIFPAGYLTIISVVQGVALGLLVQNSVSVLRDLGSPLTIALTAEQGIWVFGTIVLVFYEYIWFTIVMRWSPTFRDTFIPFALGVTQIGTAVLVGDYLSWWIAEGVFLSVGTAAFMNTVERSAEVMFGTVKDAYRATRRLLRRLAIYAFGAAALSAALAVLSAITDDPRVPSLVAVSILLAVGLRIVLLTESGLSAGSSSKSRRSGHLLSDLVS